VDPTIVPGDKSQVEACLSPFGDSGSVDMKKVCGLCLMYLQLESRVGGTRWNLVSVLVSVQYRGMVLSRTYNRLRNRFG
jgi:hypothetical protein